MTPLRASLLLGIFATAACDDPYRPSSYWSPPAGSSSPVPGELEQEVVISEVRPPPLSGGTLLISEDGRRAVVSDPDRDRIMVVDLETRAVLSTIETARGAEPGRAVEDAQGRAHVVQRNAGAVSTIDLATGSLIGTREACVAPRGIAYQSAVDSLYVACVSGTLVELPSDPVLGITAAWTLDRDLRDVVTWGDKLLVSRFRSAELLVVGLDGVLLERQRPDDYRFVPQGSANPIDFEAAVAWRLAAIPGGGAVMVHQRARSSQVVIGEPGSNFGSYAGAGDCGSAVVHTAIATVGPLSTGPLVLGSSTMGVLTLPVDVAISTEGARLAVVGALQKAVAEITLSSAEVSDGCAHGLTDSRFLAAGGDPVAAAYHPDGRLFVQLREPPMLEVHGSLASEVIDLIDLPGPSRRDSGYELFHGDPDLNAMAVVCASCHPEGREDGRVWDFGTSGLRRTQSLAHGVSGTAPFHWDGALVDLRALVDEVMVNRMGAMTQSDARVAALQSWLDSVPRLPPLIAVDAAQAARGEALFHDQVVGCDGCHAGNKLTSNESVDIGTGGEFQVPSLLGVGARAPFMHDGCAATLRDRFGPCGGDRHGTTSHLSAEQLDDLVAYLETL